jgi:hypothetical protein
MKEVKLVWVGQYEQHRDVTKNHEEALTKLVNEGWQIVTAGGGRSSAREAVGFVVLQREQS